MDGWALRLYGSNEITLDEDHDVYFGFYPANTWTLPVEIFDPYHDQLLEQGCTPSEHSYTTCDCSAVEDINATFSSIALQFYTNSPQADNMVEVVQVTIPANAFITDYYNSGTCTVFLKSE